MGLERNASRRRKPRHRLAALGVLVFMAGNLLEAGATASGFAPDYPAYLAKHQAELVPFFTAHGCDTLKAGLPILVSTAGHVLLVTALIGWVLDILLAWGYATIFAPAYAKFPRALMYACGRLALALMLTIVLTFAAMVGINAGAGLPALLIVAVLTVPAIFAQVFWVGYLYRTNARPSLLFYVALLAVHALVFAVLVPTLFAGQVNTAVAQYMDESVVPCLRTEADQAKRTADEDEVKRDAAQAQVTALQARINQDEAREQILQKQIASGQTSPAMTYGRLVRLRAQGDLAGAGTGLAAFITANPHDPLADNARGQLESVNQVLSAQLALRREQDFQAARASQTARRHLLEDAAGGRATLSEMRDALLGKSEAQVAALFGAPSETAADKWGYGRRMVYDPETRERRGLALVFSDGVVQGVDYYYGGAQ
jgi:hypothetical protein